MSEENNKPWSTKRRAEKVWCQEMTTEYFRNLSDSMPKHLQMVIKNKGNITKY